MICELPKEIEEEKKMPYPVTQIQIDQSQKKQRVSWQLG